MIARQDASGSINGDDDGQSDDEEYDCRKP